MTETFENGIYKCVSNGSVLCIIEKIGENTYKAINSDTKITAKVIPLDEYKTQVTVIEHKRKGKDGKFRNSKKLLEHNSKWLDYMLEEKGFIRKAKCVK